MLDKMLRKEITPKRVLAVLQLINMYDGRIKKKSLINLVQPKELVKNQDEVNKVIKFIIEENMASEDIDKNLHVNIKSDFFKNLKTFKEYVSKNIFNNLKNENLFFQITSEILSKDKEIYSISSADDLASYLENPQADKEYMLAWRFWAEFIGYGKTVNNQFLVNPYIRIYDRIISNKKYYNKTYTISEFISIVKIECPEFENVISNNFIGLSLTLALRTLASLGKIKLYNIKDSTEIWKLYYSAIDSSDVSNISILGDN